LKVSLGIRAQLIAAIVIMTIGGIGLVGFLAIKVVESSAVYSKANEAVNTVKLIRAVASRPSSAGEATGPLVLAGRALMGVGVGDFEFKGGAGRVLYGSGALPDEAGELISMTEGVTVRMLGGGWFRGPGEMLYVTAPLNQAQRSGAALRFTVSLAGIKEEMAVVRKFLFMYALIDSVIIIAFGVFFVGRSVISPIRKLEQAATSIAGGRLDERVDEVLDNEFGSLAASFNTMAERLETEIRALERVNEELRTTQGELLRSSTLASVGSLAAGIAHEIGNPLGAVSGYLGLLASGIEESDEEREIIERASAEISRIDAIVREFLELSRPSKRPASPTDVNRLVAEAVSTASAHRDFAGIEVETSLARALPRVLIDEGRLRQVFINILINAAHSMLNTDAQRRVSVESFTETRAGAGRGAAASRRRDDPPFGSGSAKEAAREFVVVRFTDTGCGVSDSDAEKIFDPFYTTKGVGEGTGLGLFVSQSIIKAYGGEITLAPGPGRGSAFSVVLPADRDDLRSGSEVEGA